MRDKRVKGEMTTASVRLYGELNDSLHPFIRQRRFTLRCQPESSIKALITALGIPDTDVDLIIVNGESVDFSYVVQARDRVSVYPLFRSIDISPLKKVRLLS
jgi:hypothetical protein